MLEKLGENERGAEVDIHEVVKVLGKCSFNIAIENHTCTVDQDVETAKPLNNCLLHIKQLNIYSQVTLDCHRLSGEPLRNAIQFGYVASYHCHPCPLVQIPVC